MPGSISGTILKRNFCVRVGAGRKRGESDVIANIETVIREFERLDEKKNI